MRELEEQLRINGEGLKKKNPSTLHTIKKKKLNLNTLKGNLLLNKKTSKYVAPIGLLLIAFALLVSVMLGFGGFSILAFSGYSITGYVSRLQMVFLALVGVGLMLSGIGYANYAKKQKTIKPNLMSLLYLTVSIVFFATAIFGLTSQLRGTDFWGNSSFGEIENTLIFNNLTLSSFLSLGTLQIILSIVFFKTKILGQHQLSKAAKYLTLTSGIILIIKTIMDSPLLKQSIFILSYMFNFPFPNNILSIIAPLVFLSAQISIVIILLQNQKLATK